MMLERPANGKSVAEHVQGLHQSRTAVLERYEQASANDDNHRVMTHIIGIERWIQSRIRVALGEALRDDEYDDYRPERETEWADLQTLFEETRADGIQLAENLDDSMLQQRIRHNMFGEMTLGGWLQYMDVHSDFESKRLKA